VILVGLYFYAEFSCGSFLFSIIKISNKPLKLPPRFSRASKPCLSEIISRNDTVPSSKLKEIN
jgi:hypothetical protein